MDKLGGLEAVPWPPVQLHVCQMAQLLAKISHQRVLGGSVAAPRFEQELDSIDLLCHFRIVLPSLGP